MQPSSDDWLRRGFRSGERMCVVDTLVYYRIWTDEDGTPVGVTVDYEYAEDIHFELEFLSWLALLGAAGIDRAAAELRPEGLKEVLFRDSHAVFENALIRLQLPYRKLAFY